MNKFILTIVFVLTTTLACAGQFIVFDGTTIKGRVNSCGARCSNDPNMMRATEQEYNDAGLPNKKLDFSIVNGNRVVDMTQAEIDAVAQAEADAQALAEAHAVSARPRRPARQ